MYVPGIPRYPGFLKDEVLGFQFRTLVPASGFWGMGPLLKDKLGGNFGYDVLGVRAKKVFFSGGGGGAPFSWRAGACARGGAFSVCVVWMLCCARRMVCIGTALSLCFYWLDLSACVVVLGHCTQS